MNRRLMAGPACQPGYGARRLAGYTPWGVRRATPTKTGCGDSGANCPGGCEALDMTSDLLEALRLRLAQEADPDKAPRMQAYMKSTMPYHGVTAPRVREICR